MFADQLTVSPDTVSRLLDTQFPDLAGLPIVAVEQTSTVNAIFRIGHDVAARFPLVPEPPEEVLAKLRTEAEAANELYGRTRFRTPRPIGIGAPGFGYPLPWSLQTWLPGRTAVEKDPADSPGFAEDLAGFVRGLRALDTRGRVFAGAGRGGDLTDHDEWVRTCLDRSGGLLDVHAIRHLWSNLRALPAFDAPVMAHGDLMPGNVLVDRGRLVGVLDVGRFQAADPVLDLVGGWDLLDAGPRELFREGLGCDEIEWGTGAA